MDIEPQNVVQKLKKYSGNIFKGPSECQIVLSILNHNLTEEQLNLSLIDLYLVHIFNKTNGLLSFVLDVASNQKFDCATVKSLEIIYTLINNFSCKVEQYILDINEKCLTILQGSASAKVKVKALEVLFISLEKVDKCLENQKEYLGIFEGVKYSLTLDHADSVKQKEYTVLGLFTKKFSYLITDPNSIKTYFIIELDKEMAKRCAPGNINGIFTGFGYFCESFPLSLEYPQDLIIMKKLYNHIKTLSSPTTRIRTGNRAALTFFGTYMNLFISLAINEFKQWYKRLFIEWFGLGPEEKKIAETTLTSYLFALSETVSTMETEKCMPVLKDVINWLKQLLKKENTSNTEKRLAIQGLKYLCRSLYLHFPKQEARDTFLMIMQNFEKLYIFNSDKNSEEREFLPYYVQCLASFMR